MRYGTMRRYYLKNRESKLKAFKDYLRRNKPAVTLRKREEYYKRKFKNNLRIAELRDGDPERIMDLFEKIK